MRSVPLMRTVEWLTEADSMLGENPFIARDDIVTSAFNEAIADLTQRFGADMTNWVYGDAKLHHARIAHPLDRLVSDSVRAQLSPGPLARGGYANTLNATGNSDNQTAGASFRIVVDLADWESAIATNTPGQSGDPRSRHYQDLFALWARGEYVPLPYSRDAVDRRALERVTMRP